MGVWGCGCLIFGAVMFIFASMNVRSSLVSRSWPTTEGVVFLSERPRPRDWDWGTFWRTEPSVKYRYSVDGVKYEGDTISWGQGPAEFGLSFLQTRGGDYSDNVTAADIFAWRKRYPKGTAVTVYYNPQKPQSAVLEPGFSWWGFGGILLGGTLVVGPIWSLVRRRPDDE